MTCADDNPILTTIQQNIRSAAAATNGALNMMQQATRFTNAGETDAAVDATLAADNYLSDARQLADAAITLNKRRRP